MNLYKKCKHFVDEIGTTYEIVEDKFYDYKLTDEFGIDYCTVDQMINWKVKIKKEIKD